MKKFTFALEKVLEIRRFRQEQAEIALGKAMSEEKRIQTRLESEIARRNAVAKFVEGSFDFFDISAAQRYFEFFEAKKEQILTELAQAAAVSEKARAELQTAMRKYEAVSKLKEKEQAAHQQEVFLEEEKFTDDVVTSRFGRR